MTLDHVVVATITLARDPQEQYAIEHGLSILSAMDFAAIVVVDGGSSEDFLSTIRALPRVELASPSRPGLFGQVTTSLRMARDLDSNYVFYTEPNKPHFFAEQLEAFVETVTGRAVGPADFGLALPARNAASLATFPTIQQRTESLTSELLRFIIDGEPGADYLYGPRMISRALLPILDRLDRDVGWGWMSYLLVAAHVLGKFIETMTMDLSCPPEDRVDDRRERLLRLRQMRNHIDGIHEALLLAP